MTIPGGFPGEGEPAPGNDLRPYLDRYGRAILNMYPLPNHIDPDNRYNYAFNRPEPVNRWQFVSRLDWNASEKTHAYVRLALEREKHEWARGHLGRLVELRAAEPGAGRQQVLVGLRSTPRAS